MRSLNSLIAEVRILTKKAVNSHLAEGLLLSGGLDTSIIATIANDLTSLKTFTVGFKHSQAPDIKYANIMTKHLGISHKTHIFDEEELYKAIPKVTEIMRSFDPVGTRSNIAIYIALTCAKKEGLKEVMTGDGADDRFLGYNHLLNLKREELNFELEDLLSVSQFGSNRIAKSLEIEVKQPFMDPEIKAFAKTLGVDYMIRNYNNKKWGKWILRKAFEKVLPKEIAWRRETVIEWGSGTISLTKFFEKEVSEEEFVKSKKRILEEENVVIRTKEQLRYYQAYRSTFGVPQSTKPNNKICPECNSDIPENARFCRVCGAKFTSINNIGQTTS